MHPNDMIIDAWSGLDFKKGMQGHGSVPWHAPTWVGLEDRRRLTAYTIYASYLENKARHWLTFVGDSADESLRMREEHREYGDPALVRDQIVSAIMGEKQNIVTQGAEEYSEDDQAENTPEEDTAFELQTWLREWASKEKMPLKMLETEQNAVGLGDGVYVLGWSGRKKRTRLFVYDPGFYFPVLDDGVQDDFPEKVHIAWQIPDPANRGNGKIRVRRMTWEIVRDGTRIRYPWNDEAVEEKCLFSDGIWELNLGAPRDVYSFDESKAEWQENEDGEEIYRLDIGVDFIPVVHIPNTVAVQNHFGRSSLLNTMQIFDDLSNADTDLSASSATTGKPVLFLRDASLQEERHTYRAGDILEGGPNSDMKALDTSKSLDALLKYLEHLYDRLSVNSRIPDAVMGRVDPGDAPSGVAIALTFGPLVNMINEMRLVRQDKYSTLLKFAHRFARANLPSETPAEWVHSWVTLGSFLPQDVSEAVEIVTKLLRQNAISNETAILILAEVGLPIEDVTKEISRMQGRDFEGAVQLLAATGREEHVYEYLRLEDPPGGFAQVPEPPPATGLPQPQDRLGRLGRPEDPLSDIGAEGPDLP